PESESVLSVCQDETMRVWPLGGRSPAPGPLFGQVQPRAIREALRMEGHLAKVNSVAFSPNGRYLLSGGGDVAVLWDVASGREVHRASGFGEVRSVGFSAGGRYALL